MRYRLSTAVAARFTISIFAVALALTVDASAHHGTTFFSREKADLVTIQGRVTRFDYRSPHSYLYLEAKEPSGEIVMWRFESVPVPMMKRQGWTTDSLRYGDQVTVEAFPLIDKSERFAWLGKVIKADGTILDPGRTSAIPTWYTP